MIKRLLIRKAKKVYIEEQQRERIISPETIYFIEDISKDYHSSDGVFKKSDLSKKGTVIKSNTGKEFHIIEASFNDSFSGIRKTAQTIPLKDLGFLIAESGIDAKSAVLDAGTGSGASAIFLARYAKAVHSLDISKENLEQGKRNAEYFSIKNINFQELDLYTKTPNNIYDFALLDLPEPWRALSNIIGCMKHGSFIAAYCPQITQAHQFVNTATGLGLFHAKTIEIIERDWKIEGNIVRPKSLSNIHSGFISLVRVL
jgi:tRNA A58 N-methylase Trm61